MAGNADNGRGRRGSRDRMKQLQLHSRLAVIISVIAVMGMLANMYIESEPGALPLLLVVLSIAWYVITRVRIRSHHK